ncbi:MAG: class I tRNA ligase family protein, partial [Chthoniobacterales bacterium]
ARFRQMHGPSEANPHLEEHSLSIYATEVLARLNETIAAIEDAYREFQFNVVAQQLYDFFWNDYCDLFVEAAKTEIFAPDERRKRSVLAVMDYVLSATLRLLHPLMPHVTEELWSIFGFGSGSIQFAPHLQPAPLASTANEVRARAQQIYDAVRLGRNLRATTRVPSNKKARFVLRPAGPDATDELPTIARLLNAEEVIREPSYQPAPGAPVALTPLGELYLVMSGGDKEEEALRLDKEIAKFESELRTVNQKLSNSSFVDKAPRAVVDEHKRRKSDFAAKLAQLRQARAALN